MIVRQTGLFWDDGQSPVIGHTEIHVVARIGSFGSGKSTLLHYWVAAMSFPAVSLAVFFVFGFVYRRMTRHLRGAAPLRLGFSRLMR